MGCVLHVVNVGMSFVLRRFTRRPDVEGFNLTFMLSFAFSGIDDGTRNQGEVALR